MLFALCRVLPTTIDPFVHLERAIFESKANRAAGAAKKINVTRVEFFSRFSRKIPDYDNVVYRILLRPLSAITADSTKEKNIRY